MVVSCFSVEGISEKGEIDEIFPFYMIHSCKDVRSEFLNKLSFSSFLVIEIKGKNWQYLYVDRFLILRKIVTILKLKSSNVNDRTLRYLERSLLLTIGFFFFKDFTKI